MREQAITHLNAEEIAVAVVDEKDLADAARRHLAACPACAERKAALEQALASLGRSARENAPPLGRKIRLWGVQQGARRAVFPLRPVMATALASAAVAVMGWWILSTGVFMGPGPGAVNPVVSEEALMEELAAISEDPLPAVYREMTDVLTQEGNGGFLDFVAPLPQGRAGIS